MFKITVVQTFPEAVNGVPVDLPRFEKTVDTLDFHKLAVLVNPPPKRVYKRKADAKP